VTALTSAFFLYLRSCLIMKKVVCLFMLVFGVLAGCSNKNETQNNESSPSLEIIEVTIQTPDLITLNEEVSIQALVKQGNDQVDDANEVKFELWKVGQEEHEKINAQNDGKGLYSIKKTFTENGKYIVTAHVTARSMHAMPRKDFTVGILTSEQEQVTEERDSANNESAHEEGQDDHGHHKSSLEIEFNKVESFTVNKEVALKASLKHKGAPLIGAKVRFEIIPDETNSTEWIDAIEDGEGDYSSSTIFKKTGTYHIQIHVNIADIHDHKVVMIHVK
jgi:hypothetical protein